MHFVQFVFLIGEVAVRFSKSGFVSEAIDGALSLFERVEQAYEFDILVSANSGRMLYDENSSHHLPHGWIEDSGDEREDGLAPDGADGLLVVGEGVVAGDAEDLMFALLRSDGGTPRARAISRAAVCS